MPFRPKKAGRKFAGFGHAHSLFDGLVMFKLCVPNTFKVVGHLRHNFNINTRKEHELYFCGLEKTANTLI